MHKTIFATIPSVSFCCNKSFLCLLMLMLSATILSYSEGIYSMCLLFIGVTFNYVLFISGSITCLWHKIFFKDFSLLRYISGIELKASTYCFSCEQRETKNCLELYDASFCFWTMKVKMSQCQCVCLSWHTFASAMWTNSSRKDQERVCSKCYRCNFFGWEHDMSWS